VLFEDRHAAGFEFCDPFAVDVRANDFVPGFREARSGYQAHVPTSDD
jgi:hypothetical protein